MSISTTLYKIYAYLFQIFWLQTTPWMSSTGIVMEIQSHDSPNTGLTEENIFFLRTKINSLRKKQREREKKKERRRRKNY